ncbi:MAG: DEAD/DEAH box helicase [Candidatus Bipolaricaulota bacterium]
MSFDRFALHPRVLSGVRDVGFTSPTPIQEQAIPAVLARRDVLGLAQTGTGKTAAFMLPVLDRLVRQPGQVKGTVRALVLAPTRELAEQIHQTARDFGRHTALRSAVVYGGVSKRAQEAALRRGVDVVIACPGRLLDHLGDGELDLSHVEVLVLDEADRMCDMGFLPDIRRILRHLPPRRQTLFFCATMPQDIRALAQSLLHDPAMVQVDAMAPARTVSHALYPVPETLKTSLLLALLRRTATGRVLVFTRTKYRARNLALALAKAGHRAAALQGNMSQAQRQTAIDGFRGERYDILVATDVAARGIDVSGITHVINVDIPGTVDAYIHRIGRTGRADQVGEAFTLASPADTLLVRDVERAVGAPIERRRLPDFDYGDFSPETQFAARIAPAASLPRSFRKAPGTRSGSPYVSRHRPRPGSARVH